MDHGSLNRLKSKAGQRNPTDRAAKGLASGLKSSTREPESSGALESERYQELKRPSLRESQRQQKLTWPSTRETQPRVPEAETAGTHWSRHSDQHRPSSLPDVRLKAVLGTQHIHTVRMVPSPSILPACRQSAIPAQYPAHWLIPHVPNDFTSTIQGRIT